MRFKPRPPPKKILNFGWSRFIKICNEQIIKFQSVPDLSQQIFIKELFSLYISHLGLVTLYQNSFCCKKKPLTSSAKNIKKQTIIISIKS